MAPNMIALAGTAEKDENGGTGLNNPVVASVTWT
jgi:hypothetical protein